MTRNGNVSQHPNNLAELDRRTVTDRGQDPRAQQLYVQLQLPNNSGKLAARDRRGVKIFDRIRAAAAQHRNNLNGMRQKVRGLRKLDKGY